MNLLTLMTIEASTSNMMDC